jgi:hypothetical protein
MADAASDRIEIIYALTGSDYAKYLAAAGRRGRSWTNFNILLAVLFSAIPVALLLRWYAAQESHDPVLIEMVGYCSLFAYALGFFATMASWVVIERIAAKRYLESMPQQPDSRTTVFDRHGITMTGKTAQATWQWAAIGGMTRQDDLLVLWIISSTALMIPCRGFADEDAAIVFIRARLAEARAARTGGAPPAQ